jgi:aspartate/methionine/tyrosine aminotransferase
VKSAGVNPLLVSVASPAIVEARAWLAAYEGERGPVFDLSQAAPPYPPSQELLDRLACAAADPEFSRYGPVAGETCLREAYADHVSKLYGTDLLPSGISITAGCNQAFMIAMMCVAGPGDTVILPAPWYFNHKMTLDMLGIRTRPLQCLPENNFIPDLKELEVLIRGNVRAVVLTTPNNPTGANYPPAVIEAISKSCQKSGVWLILDETYRDFIDDSSVAPHNVFASERRHATIGIYSFSKSLAIPGFRLGAMTYPPALAENVIKVQDCMQICAVRAGQVAVAWALTNLYDWRREKQASFEEKRRQLCLEWAAAEGWTIDSIGAYFAYVRHPFPQMDAVAVAKRIASENGVLMIPGPFFGPHQERHLRLSFGGLSADELQNMTSRLAMQA